MAVRLVQDHLGAYAWERTEIKTAAGRRRANPDTLRQRRNLVTGEIGISRRSAEAVPGYWGGEPAQHAQLKIGRDRGPLLRTPSLARHRGCTRPGRVRLGNAPAGTPTRVDVPAGAGGLPKLFAGLGSD